jgi:hypothetical protein
MPATKLVAPEPKVSEVLMDQRPAQYKKPFMVIVKWGLTGSRVETPHFHSREQAESYRASFTHRSRSGRRILLSLDCDGTTA